LFDFAKFWTKKTFVLEPTLERIKRMKSMVPEVLFKYSLLSYIIIY
jgi:hypothetical protein